MPISANLFSYTAGHCFFKVVRCALKKQKTHTPLIWYIHFWPSLSTTYFYSFFLFFLPFFMELKIIKWLPQLSDIPQGREEGISVLTVLTEFMKKYHNFIHLHINKLLISYRQDKSQYSTLIIFFTQPFKRRRIVSPQPPTCTPRNTLGIFLGSSLLFFFS